MLDYFQKQKSDLIYKFISLTTTFSFLFNFVVPVQLIYAQTASPIMLNLPAPGTMVSLSPAFTPPLIRGLTIHPDNPFKFDFIIDGGDNKIVDEELKKEAGKLVRYFMAALTVPEDELWVNLSPYEKDRIIPTSFGQTEMGRELLAQDYLLKQLTSSLMFPEGELGQRFWERVHVKSRETSVGADVPINTFNKIWIVPERAVVYEHNATAFVVDSYLKVMLEEDYLALQNNSDKHVTLEEGAVESVSEVSSQIIREVLIPEIEREVNQGKNFAALRQIYNSVILASWYKKNLRESLLGQVYVDQNKTKGIEIEDSKEQIYNQYLETFKQGVYDYIKEDYDPVTQEVIPRKYFSGGVFLQTGESTSEIIRIIDEEKTGEDRAHNQVGFRRFLDRLQKSGAWNVRVWAKHMASRAGQHVSSIHLKPFEFRRRPWTATTILGALLLASTPSPAEMSEEQVLKQSVNKFAIGSLLLSEDIDVQIQRFIEELNRTEEDIGRYETRDLSRPSVLVDATLEDFLSEAELRLRYPLSDRWMFDPSVRLGLIGDGQWGFDTLSNSILRPSPYGGLDFIFDYDGAVTSRMGLGLSFARVGSTAMPLNNLKSPLEVILDPEQTVPYQNWLGASAYFDLGKTFLLRENLAFTLFGGIDVWTIHTRLNDFGDVLSTRGMFEQTIGANVIHYLGGTHRWRGFADASFGLSAYDFVLQEIARGQSAQTIFPKFQSATIGADYTRFFPGERPQRNNLFTVGLYGTLREPSYEIGTRLQLLWGSFRFQGETVYERSRASFAFTPNEWRVNAGVFYRPEQYRFLEVGIDGFYQRFQYPLIRETHTNFGGRLAVNLNFTTFSDLLRGELKGRTKVIKKFTPSTAPGKISSQEPNWVASSALLDVKALLDIADNVDELQGVVDDISNGGAIFDRLDDIADLLADIRINGLTAQNIPKALELLDVIKGADISVGHFNSLEGLLAETTNGKFPFGALSGIKNIVAVINDKGFNLSEFESKLQDVNPKEFRDLRDLAEFIRDLQGILDESTTLTDFVRNVQIGLTQEESSAIIRALTILDSTEGNVVMRNRFLASADAKLRRQPFLTDNYPEEEPSMDLLHARWMRMKTERQIRQLQERRSRETTAGTVSGWVQSPTQSDQQMSAQDSGRKNEVGGIDLDPSMINLEIKQNGNSIPIPVPVVPASNIRIDGLLPVIINITPITNLPLQLGISEPEERDAFNLTSLN